MLSLLSVNISRCVFNGHYDVVRSRWKYLNSWEHFATVKMVVEVQTTRRKSFKILFCGQTRQTFSSQI